MAENKASRIHELDILKAVGFFMVFLAHYNQMFPGIQPLLHKALMYGQTGCQLFLMVTGFLLAASFEKQREKRNRLLQRLFDIAPGYYIAFFIYFGLNLLYSGVFYGSPFQSSYTPWGILGNAVFAHGLLPFCNNNIVPGGWYIGTLVLTYLLVPLVLPILLCSRRKRLLAPVISCGISVALTFAGSRFAPTLVGNNTFFFYSLPCQAPAVLIGIALYCEREHIQSLGITKAGAVFLVFSVLTLGLLALENAVLIAMVPCTAALSFVGLYALVRRAKWLCSAAWLQKIGRASYGIYLTHFVFAWYIPYALRQMHICSDGLMFMIALIPCAAVACILGEVITKVLQKIAVVCRKCLCTSAHSGK